jgi:hypothetical protein
VCSIRTEGTQMLGGTAECEHGFLSHACAQRARARARRWQISMMRRQGPEGTLNEGEPISLSNDLAEE